MTNPNQSPHPTELTLPVVSPEVGDALVREIVEDPEYFHDCLDMMCRENPHLAEGIGRVIEMCKDDKDRANELLIMAAVTYRLLRSQAEADSLNNLWEQE